MGKKATGLVIVLTGGGAGKTTAALGQAMRAVGNDLKVAMIQFIKSRRTGEHVAAERLSPNLEIHLTGCGFVKSGPGSAPRPQDVEAARRGLNLGREKMTSGKFEMVILDEIICAAGLGLLKWQDIMTLLDERPADVHLVLTGRGATAELIQRADLVTEMQSIKHPFERGTAAQAGIEF